MGRDHQKLLNKLEEFRKMAKLTQEELSVKAEVSRKSINAIENGVYVPSTVLALKISKTLNCNVEDLFKLPCKSCISIIGKGYVGEDVESILTRLLQAWKEVGNYSKKINYNVISSIIVWSRNNFF